MAAHLSYHIPFVGNITASLHAEAERIYQTLTDVGELDRLKRLDHLGLMRAAWEGAHHSRWEYTILILALLERCKDVPEIHLSSPIDLRTIRVSSGYELLKAWALTLNVGHLVWTFSAERALLLEIWRGGSRIRTSFGELFDHEEVRGIALQTLRLGQVYRLFQILAFARLRHLIRDGESADLNLCNEALEAYVLPTQPDDQQLIRLKALYRNLRRLAYLTLDTQYTPSMITVDLRQALTDRQTFSRLILRDEAREADELDGISPHLERETYLGKPVLTEIARRERPLRAAIHDSLKSRSLIETIERLADGSLQAEVQPSHATSIVRVTSDSAGPFSVYWPAADNVRLEQHRIERSIANARETVVALHWRTAAGADWVLQSHTLEDSRASVPMAYMVVWHRATLAHARAREDLERPSLADAYSDRLASTLLLQALPLFFDARLRWEFGGGVSWGALLTLRRDARGILTRQSIAESQQARTDELLMLARTLRGSPNTYAAVSVAPLIAYDGATQVAEIDGIFLEASPQSLRLTLVEAKRMNSGAATAARRALQRAIKRLVLASDVRTTPIRTEGLAAGLARAWIELTMGA